MSIAKHDTPYGRHSLISEILWRRSGLRFLSPAGWFALLAVGAVMTGAVLAFAI
jgi:hypothetical protein